MTFFSEMSAKPATSDAKLVSSIFLPLNNKLEIIYRLVLEVSSVGRNKMKLIFTFKFHHTTKAAFRCFSDHTVHFTYTMPCFSC